VVGIFVRLPSVRFNVGNSPISVRSGPAGTAIPTLGVSVRKPALRKNEAGLSAGLRM
jgi:hypothetical protein